MNFLKKSYFKKPWYIWLLVGIALVYILITANKIGDFNVFLGAAELLSQNKPIYNVWIEQNTGNYCLYFYSPLFAFILYPFIHLPFYITNLLWLFANLVFLFRATNLLSDYIDVGRWNEKKRILFYFISFILVLRFLLGNFEMGQMTVFLLWASLESLRLFNRNSNMMGALLLALVINIKLMPIVLIPYLLYRAYWKASLYTILFIVILTFLPAIFIGWDYNMTLLKEWVATINPLGDEHNFGETGLGTHSLTSLIPSLFMQIPGEIQMKRNLFQFSPQTVILIINLSRAFLILLTLWFLRSKPFMKSVNKIQTLYEISFIFLIVPLIFPHQQKYNFFFILPAVFYIVFFLFENHKYLKMRFQFIFSIILLGIFFILTALTTDGIIGKELSNITQHFKIATYGIIILIIPLYLCQPQKTMVGFFKKFNEEMSLNN